MKISRQMRQLAKNIRKNYNKIIVFQPGAKFGNSERCLNIYDNGCRCVIGAGLGRDAIRIIKKKQLIGYGISVIAPELGFKGVTKEEYDSLRLLQSHHDNTLKGRETLEGFKAHLDNWLNKYDPQVANA